MKGKIEQTKFYQRENFTPDEKYDIWQKSNGKCSHCGKELYENVKNDHNLTIDHFIPLFKGGSNHHINLIPLCENCNKEKGAKILSIDYIKHLKPKHLKELKGYLDSYLKVTDYVQRHRLLAYDEYEDYVVLNKSKKFSGIKSKYKVKLATWDDLDRLYEYFIKYLKKYNALDDENVAMNNLIFWLQFGCIYYVERNNEIIFMTVATIKSIDKNEDFRGLTHLVCFYTFAYYVTDLAFLIGTSVIYNLPTYIIQENNLKFIPVCYVFHKNDKFKDLLAGVWHCELHQNTVSFFRNIHTIIGDVESRDNFKSLTYDEMSDDEKATYNFLKKFDDMTDNLIDYFSHYAESEDIGWMIDTIISGEVVKNNETLYDLFVKGSIVKND